MQTPLQKFVKASIGANSSKHDDITISARTPSQKEYLRQIYHNDIILAAGPAGTGKTYLASLYALNELVESNVDKIILIRPNIQLHGEEKLGALPGNIAEKMSPILRPIIEIFEEYLGTPKLDVLMDKNVIEIVPIQFIRGRSFKNSIILVDEAQNLSSEAMKAVLTRIGENSKLIITGDVNQSDRAENNGFKTALQIFSENHVDNLSCASFEIDDIVRHETVSEILKVWKD